MLIIHARTTGQDAFQHENGEVGPEEFLPRKCDIITISGRAEKCELAKADLLVGAVFAQAMNLPFFFFFFWIPIMLPLSSRLWFQ